MSAERSRLRSFPVDVVPLASSGRSIERHRVTVPKFGSTSILVDAVAIAAGIDPENCVLAEIFSARVYKFFEEADRLEDIGSGDVLLLYELVDAPSFRKPAKKRWGVGADVKEGDMVIVKTTFLSDSEGELVLNEGDYGLVAKVDDEGDARIRFDEPGWGEPQWVFKSNLGYLMVDLAMDSDRQKCDPDDGEVYTLRQYIDVHAGCLWTLKGLHEYWNDSMQDVDDDKQEQNPQPGICGVVVTFRKKAQDEKKPAYFGLPFVFCTQREMSVSKLTKAIRTELKKGEFLTA